MGGFCSMGAEAFASGMMAGRPYLAFNGERGPGARPEADGLYLLFSNWPEIQQNAEWNEHRRYTLADRSVKDLRALFANDDSPSTPYPPCASLHEDGNEAYFSLLRAWIDDCNAHGDHAQLFSEDPKLPTRLLDVRDPAQLQLFCPKEDDRGKFTALSHSWGGFRPLVTDTGNIEDHCRGIPIDRVPKLYRDAAEVTRRIGVEFLWIDSLCIIQDDQRDWEQESRRMDFVFSSAYCTIAATSAENCTKGFLERPSAKTCIQSSELDEHFQHDVEQGILNQRGWVFQERALSRRTIHFTSTRTYWECGSVIRDECLGHSFR